MIGITIVPSGVVLLFLSQVGQQVFEKTRCGKEKEAQGICEGAELLEIVSLVGKKVILKKAGFSSPAIGDEGASSLLLTDLAAAAIPFSKRPVMEMAASLAEAVLNVCWGGIGRMGFRQSVSSKSSPPCTVVSCHIFIVPYRRSDT